jgi:hypothetical protein
MSDDSNLTVKITLTRPLERIVTICYLLCRGKGMKKFSGNLKHGVTGKMERSRWKIIKVKYSLQYDCKKTNFIAIQTKAT